MDTNSKLQLDDFKCQTLEGILATFAKLERLRPWFEERGYFLNRVSCAKDRDTDLIEYTYPHFRYKHNLFKEPPRIQLPYSNFGGDLVVLQELLDGDVHPLRTGFVRGIIFAQDGEERHVAMKLVKEGSVVYQAYHRLCNESSLYESDPQKFGCVLPPLNFLELYDGLWFIVLPRWGRHVFMPEFNSIGEILHFMRCLLMGLSILHKNLIVHGDIKESNILISHFSERAHNSSLNKLRLQLRSHDQLTYAWIDFDFGAISPLDSKPAERRRPAAESFVDWCSRAEDTRQGEIDYDPFAFDVGSLGFFFCKDFQWCSRVVPMLAPFLDRMITRDLAKRFTASEALQFFDEHIRPSVPHGILRSQPPTRGKFFLPEEFDRWAGLDPEFIEAWSSYRNPPLPLSTKILRRICDVPIGRACVLFVRKGARFVCRQMLKIKGQ